MTQKSIGQKASEYDLTTTERAIRLPIGAVDLGIKAAYQAGATEMLKDVLEFLSSEAGNYCECKENSRTIRGCFKHTLMYAVEQIESRFK